MALSVNKIDNLSFTNASKLKTDKLNDRTSFSSQETENPISKKGERLKLATAAFVGGLGIGAKLLWQLFDGDFLWETFGKGGIKTVEKNHKSASGNKKAVLSMIAGLGLAGIFIGGFALLYTIYKTPKIMYEGKINAFTKGKDMDVYIKGNEAEKEIYTQMNNKAKSADEEEKAKLRTQYMQMQMAKNRVPDFIKLKK